MTAPVQMAHRSDRREVKPENLWANQARLDDWLLARGFHFGQEGKRPIPHIPLHKQAGDTSARLTYRCQYRRELRNACNKSSIGGPTLKT